MFKGFSESSAVCTLADRQLEQGIVAKLERGRVAMYSMPTGYGLVSSWRGQEPLRLSANHRSTLTKW
jgi:hypothetical protein